MPLGVAVRDRVVCPGVRINGVVSRYIYAEYAAQVALLTGGEFVWWVRPTLWARLRGRGFRGHVRQEPPEPSNTELALAHFLAMGWRPGEERITQECVDSWMYA